MSDVISVLSQFDSIFAALLASAIVNSLSKSIPNNEIMFTALRALISTRRDQIIFRFSPLRLNCSIINAIFNHGRSVSARKSQNSGGAALDWLAALRGRGVFLINRVEINCCSAQSDCSVSLRRGSRRAADLVTREQIKRNFLGHIIC